MADWKDRAQVHGDVVFFEYVAKELEREAQEVYVWDLDKTYLDTHLGSLSDLIKTAMEKAFQKRNVPGTRSLVQALMSARERYQTNTPFPLYFITASPPQIEPRIYEKLLLDGIQPYGSFYKDNLRNLRPRRLWRLTQQIGYKLQALLQLRRGLSDSVRQVCWGDDSESDAVIYSLYSDICARRLGVKELREVLKELRVNGEQTDTIIQLQGQVPEQDPVEKIYINLAVDTDPEYYSKFGRRMLPTYNSVQIALDLYQDGRLTTELVVKVIRDVVTNYGFTTDEVAWSLDDLIRRQVLGQQSLESIAVVLKENQLLAESFKPSIAPLPVANQEEGRVYSLEGVREPWVPERVDYLHDYR